MRTIKFRGKRFDTGKWVYGYYFKTPLTDENSGTLPAAGWSFLVGDERHCIGQDTVAFVVAPESVGEFTGLFDKNGIEIYEGDILQYDRTAMTKVGAILGPVFFERGKYRLKNQIGSNNYLGSPSFQKVWKIIGNIYENPELLKTKEE